MKLETPLFLMCALAIPSVAFSQNLPKWESPQQQQNDAALPQEQATHQAPSQAAPQPPAEAEGIASVNASASDKAECDAEVARSYPVNLWAPGLKQKREELFAACMSKRANPEATGNSPSISKTECDAEVARTYPVNLWAPGLGKKRQELFAACMAR